MALRLRTNGAPLSGALFVSNPRRRKKAASTKRRRKAASTRRRRTTRSNRRSVAKRTARAGKRLLGRVGRKATSMAKRRNTAAAKRRAAARKAAATRRRNAMMRSRAAKKGAATRKRNTRRNALAMRIGKRTVKMGRKTKSGIGRVGRKAVSMAKGRRRNGTKKGMVRTTARRAYTKRRNSAVTGFQNKVFAPIKRFVGKIPLIGSTAQKFVAPLAFGAAAGVVHYGGVKLLQRYAPQYARFISPVAGSVAGSFVAALLLMGNKIPGLKKVSAETRQQVAAAALVVGGGLDAYRALSRNMGDLGDLGAEVPLYDFSGIGVDLGGLGVDMGALGVDLGDGGAFDVVPLPQNMGSPALLTGGMIDYSGAHMGDAMSSPADLSIEEGEAALAGPASWHSRFGQPPVIRTSHGGHSPYAGRPGHRFGWLIKLIGFDRFRQIAALPPGQRVAFIAQMKQQSIALADTRIAGAEMSGIGVDMGAVMTAGAIL